MHSWMTSSYPLVYSIQVWPVQRPHIWHITALYKSYHHYYYESGVLCRSSSVLLRMHGALESWSRQQLDKPLGATVWAARHHSNMAVWKPDQCTRNWRHRLKPTCRHMSIKNQWGMLMSWTFSSTPLVQTLSMAVSWWQHHKRCQSKPRFSGGCVTVSLKFKNGTARSQKSTMTT